MTRVIVLQVTKPVVAAPEGMWAIQVGIRIKKYGRWLMEKKWIFGMEKPAIHSWIEVALLE